MNLIDSHAHLDGEAFEEDRSEVIERAFAAGVVQILNVGATDGWKGAERSIALCKEYPGQIFCSVGIHPHDAETPLQIEKLEELASASSVKAIGETGLDFFRDWSPRDKQELWFRAQIQLAKKLTLPIIIHSREAGTECLEILKEEDAGTVGGVFHCYSENASFAEKLREIDFSVSFPGTLTFPKATAVRDAARDIPLEQILLETDSPYISPVPHRGKRCESSYVVETAKALAEAKGLSLEEVCETTTVNSRERFNLPT